MNELVITDSELQIVKHSQTLMQTSYDDRLLANTIAQNIALPKDSDATVNMADVLQVLRIASGMHLDAFLGGVWAYKDKNNRLVCGVSKKGWQQALATQPDFCGLEFQNIGELQSKKVNVKGSSINLTYYNACKCIIKKMLPNGSVGTYEATAYFDEECDLTKPTWQTRPKRLLEGRALTICASNAYGWGAYDKDEVLDVAKREGDYVTKNVIDAPIVDNTKQLENKTDKELLIERMTRATSKTELRKLFKESPVELQADNDIIKIGKKISQTL